MYCTLDSSDSLSQGDVCRGVPLPIVTAATVIYDQANDQQLGAVVPDVKTLGTRSRLMAAMPLTRVDVLVLSQSCDAERAQSDPSARILVAPLVPDDDERFIARYAKATSSAATAQFKKMAESLNKGKQLDQGTLTRGQVAMSNPRQHELEQLWLGNVIGAFPIAADSSSGIRRSVCFLDSVVSLPASWVPLIRSTRVLRLNAAWGAVLQETLREWLGRYGFPGTNDDRLRDGGLLDAAPDEQAGSKSSE